MPMPTGAVPEPVTQAFAAGLFDLPKRTAGPGLEAAQSRWYIPVLLVDFSDHPLTHTAAEFETALFDTTHSTPSGSVYDYYQWASGGRVRVQGKVIATIHMPNTRDFYAYSFYGLTREATPQNLCGLTRDALLSITDPIDWSQFDVDHDGWVDMLWVVHQGVGGETTVDRTNLWSVTSRLSAGWRFGAPFDTQQLLPGSSSAHYQVDRFSTVPELSAIIPGRRAEIGTYCHEFGHALGLPDLYDTSGLPQGVSNYGPGNWSLMATGGYGGSGLTPERPSGLGGWCQLFLGWATSVRPSQDSLVTLRPVSRGDPLIEFWFQGESNPEHFILENRYREDFDATLPNDGLMITHVDESAIALRLNANRINSGLTPGLMMVEGDARNDLFYGINRGEASDPLPGSLHRTSFSDVSTPNARTFAGAFTGISLGQIEQQGENVKFALQVRAPGWQSEVPVGPAFDAIYDSGRPGRWARTDEQGRVFAVRGELVGGRSEIVLRSRIGNVWQPGEVVSQSPVSAFDPTIACLPGGDLAVAWTDARTAKLQIYLRVRIRGVWQPEVAIADLEGNAHHAAIGADAHGMVQVAWVQDAPGSRRIYFKRFGYISPFGSPSPVTLDGELPDPPALEVQPNGSSYIVWSDRAFLPRLYFARFSPDSGVSQVLPLTFAPAAPQVGVSAAIDPTGNLHVAWQVAGSAVNELHYQRRRADRPPSPPDTVLHSAGYLLQNPSIACDDSGGVHLVYENWGSQSPIPTYRLWAPTHGWDFGGTEISIDGSPGLFPTVLPHTTHDITSLYVRDDVSHLQLVQRTRQMGVTTTTAVGTPPAEAAPAALRLAPNPLRAGARLVIAGVAGDREARVEIFDLSGRRVADVPARPDGAALRAEIGPSITAGWTGGVYFARLRGERAARRFVVLR